MKKHHRIVTIACIAPLAFMTIPLGACNTIQGIGEDISAVGRSLTGTSKNVQDDGSLAGHSDEKY